MATDPNQERPQLNPIPEENKGNIEDITGDDGVDNSLELKQDEDVNDQQPFIAHKDEVAEQQAIESDIIINQSRKTRNNNNPPIMSTITAKNYEYHK